ncbi:MAG: hypothetical protein RSD57_19785 [Comamonas sp.]|jgi:hypothetical protein
MDQQPLLEVRLCDYPQLDSRHRIDAEQRFSRTLVRYFNNLDELIEARKAFIDCSESYDPPKPEALQLATSWQKAFLKANEAGMRPLGAAEEAYFDVRVAH